jgi:hypothetical protein
LRSVVNRVEALKAALDERKPPEPEDVAARLLERMEEWKREQGRYASLTVAEKIVCKQRELDLLPADAVLAEYRRRCVELDILELRGASPEWLQVARDQALECVRRQHPMPKIVTHDEAVAILAAEKAQVESIAGPASLPMRQRRADVIELDDYRPRDALADYRGRQQSQLEPTHV